jgi:hypothetical protein
MTQPSRVCLLLACIAVSVASPYETQPCQDHVAWVGDAMVRMYGIKAGMRRSDLLKVFKTEGGISTGLYRTYASRDCIYFKVDVEFEAVGRPNRNGDGRVTSIEDPRDIIRKISRPYVAFVVTD